MAIEKKCKATKDISNADARNIYDYILALQHNNMFLQSERNMHDIVTYNSEHLYIMAIKSDITNRKKLHM